MIEAKVEVIQKREIGRADMYLVASVVDAGGEEVGSHTTGVLHLGEGETGTWPAFELPRGGQGGKLVVSATDRDWRLGQRVTQAVGRWAKANPAKLAALHPAAALAVPVLEVVADALGDDVMGTWVVPLPLPESGELRLEPEAESGPRAVVTLAFGVEPVVPEVGAPVGEEILDRPL